MNSMGFPVPFCAYPLCKGQLTINAKTLFSHSYNGCGSRSWGKQCFSLSEEHVRDRMKTIVAVISHIHDTCFIQRLLVDITDMHIL